MYKVLLIDDEAIIVEGLMRFVPWESFSCRIAGTASDGVDGANKIRTLKPDIVFADIRMPNCDGLTMLAGLKSEFPDLQVAVLTGYRDFSYAQEAIRLGVTRFLLKPSKMDELEEALKAMVENLKKHKPASEPEGEESHSEAAGSFIVRQALAYIEAHYSEKLSLGDVADSCFVSQWHLSKLLNKHTNQSFYDILNNQRIREAKKLLSDPTLKISEISERVGYTDTAHFSRVFKKLEDISANEYRNLYSQIEPRRKEQH